MCSVKKVLLQISQNAQENTCTRVSFLLIKLQAWGNVMFHTDVMFLFKDGLSLIGIVYLSSLEQLCSRSFAILLPFGILWWF